MESKSKNGVSKKNSNTKIVISKAKSKSKTKITKADIIQGGEEELEGGGEELEGGDEEELEGGEEELEGGDEDLEDEKVGRKKRHKATIYDHIDHYNQLLNLIKFEIDRKSRSKESGVRVLQKARKMVEDMRKELSHVTRSKEARNALSTRKNTSSGFTMKYYVSEELANFLQLDASTDTVSRIDATRAICVYAHLKENEKREDILAWSYLNPGCARDLQNPANKKTILPDATLASLLQYNQYKKDVKSGDITQKTKNKQTGVVGQKKVAQNALDYTSIQRLISHHFLQPVEQPVEVEEEEEVAEEEEAVEEAEEEEEADEEVEEAEEEWDEQ